MNPAFISTFKRTQQFRADDFEILKITLDSFNRRLTTPAILTEVNSLGNQLASHHKDDFYRVMFEEIAQLLEFYIPSKQLVQNPAFFTLGLTDTSIIVVSSEQACLTLTDDARLAYNLDLLGSDVLNFSNLRQYLLE